MHRSRVQNPRMEEFDIHDRVNYAAKRSFVRVKPDDKSISLEELFSGTRYSRQGNEMAESGLFVDLPAWGYHFFEFHITTSAALDR